jgi:hypothetical protein
MQVFTLAAATGRPWLVVVPAVVVLLLVAVLLVAAMRAPQTVRFEVSPAGLQLRGDFYGRFIPSQAIVVEHARRVDFSMQTELSPARRTMGTGLPGYQAGWFRLQGGQSALVYLTDRTKAVYIPTDAGYALLLSPQDPDAFIAALTATSSRP